MGLEKIRKRIDEIDSSMVGLLDERAALAMQAAAEKDKQGMEFFSNAREKQVLDNALAKSNSKMPKEAISKIFTEIISGCRSLEKPIKIAFLGPETTFTHMAALKKFGSSVELVAKDSIPTIFASVEKSESDYGVVPVENSMEGSVVSTYDMFLNSELNIAAEITLDVKHDLLAKGSMTSVKKVFSHPQAFAQCKKWLKENLPTAELFETSSTAKAAELATKTKNSAAIASSLAAKTFGLNVLCEDIQDSAKNITRFLVIGKKRQARANKNKTSILFSVTNEPGSLFDALEALKRHGINMTKIESRPSKQKAWEVVFFIDFEGYSEDENVKQALEEMKPKCLFLRVLGSYAEEMSISQ